MLSTYYGFKIDNSNLMIPIARRTYQSIPLNAHTMAIISAVKVHSFTLSAYTTTVGVDRNLRNATVGNEDHHTIYDLSEVVEIKKRYRKKKSHLHRNDRRIQKKITSKYGKRERSRTKRIIHETSKTIVESAVRNNDMIVLENLNGLYRKTKKGDGRGTNYRFLLKNAFPYGMLASQIMYKGAWEGVPVMELSREETMNTSKECSVCGSLTRIA